MRKLSLLIVTTLLLSGCSTGEKVPTAALSDIPSCDQIDTSKVTNKTLQMNCLDGSSVVNFHSIKGPIIVNVWASWCEGCKEEMPYFINLYANQLLIDHLNRQALIFYHFQHQFLSSGTLAQNHFLIVLMGMRRRLEAGLECKESKLEIFSFKIRLTFY